VSSSLGADGSRAASMQRRGVTFVTDRAGRRFQLLLRPASRSPSGNRPVQEYQDAAEVDAACDPVGRGWKELQWSSPLV
jgi:hypothetical protein